MEIIPIFTRKYRTFSISVKVILMQRCLLKNNLDVWNRVSRKSSYKLMVKTKLLVVFWKTLADRKLFIFDPMCYTIDDLCSIFVKKGREDIKVIEVINSTCVGDKKGLKTFFFFILIGCAYWIGNERLYNSSVNDM